MAATPVAYPQLARNSGPGSVVLGSYSGFVHGLALVLWSRLVFDDGAIVEVEPA